MSKMYKVTDLIKEAHSDQRKSGPLAGRKFKWHSRISKIQCLPKAPIGNREFAFFKSSKVTVSFFDYIIFHKIQILKGFMI